MLTEQVRKTYTENRDMDLKAASDRVRRWMAGEWLPGIYPASKVLGMAVASLEQDWRDLAVGYLADHLPDDDEPTTSEWLKSIGWQASSHFALIETVAGQQMEWRAAGMWIGETPIALTDTRGKVRRLCAAMGVHLLPAEQPREGEVPK